jgi:RHS repeat-associated protein
MTRIFDMHIATSRKAMLGRSALAGLGLACFGLSPALAAAPEVPAAAVTQSAHFEEKLVPAMATSTAENAALIGVLQAYAAQPAKDDFSGFKAFLQAYPNSGWRVALLADMGLLDYQYGYFSRAIDDFHASWEAGRDNRDPQVKALVDRVAGELLRMHARLGHADQIDSLLAEIGDRKLTGSATEDLKGAKQGLWMMRHNPGVSYLCGPMALKNLLLAIGRPASDVDFLDAYRSGPQGVSLAEVATLAAQAKLDFRLVHREAGQPIPIPSIVHWKVSHFAAIVGESNGRYHVKDPTFGRDLWVARGALDTETSGYYLVPGHTGLSTWRVVDNSEAGHVRGMGFTQSQDPNAVTVYAPRCRLCSGSSKASGSSAIIEDDFGSPDDDGMTQYSFVEMVSSLQLQDSPVGYAPPKGPPVPVTITYNQREANQPANFTFYNVSPKWTLNWLAYIQDDPTNIGNNVSRIVGGGGAIPESSFAANAFAPEEATGAVLSYTAGATASYTLTFPDGSANTYALPNGATTYPRIIFITSQADRYGNKLSFTYDSQFRLTAITDATARKTTFTYGNTSFPLQVTKITDPFARSATLAYDSTGRLTSITDVLGLVSTYAYDGSSLVDSLTTPYGTTNFSYGQNGNSLYLQATDPLGYTERTEFIQGAPGIPFSDPSNLIPVGIVNPFNSYLNDRDTYYWDKHAYAVASGDYTRARNTHWVHLTQNTNVTGDVVESIKAPLENRVWFNYPGEPVTGGLGTAQSGSLDSPSAMGRVLDDGSTQLTTAQYDSIGNLTSKVDAIGRQTSWTYAANQTDLVSIQQKTGANTTATLAQYGNYVNHQPQTYTDAAGKVWKLAYNASGQVTQKTDPLGYTTNYVYNATGYLTTVTNQNGVVTGTYTYDTTGRIASITDSEGWVVKYTYDAMNRVTLETYPDGTTRKYTYTKLDLASVTDRQGRVTSYTYDANRNLLTLTDPNGDVTKFARYENGKLKTLTDANGNVTTYAIDVESRPISKTDAAGAVVTNTWQNSISRIASVTDALGQTKQYTYTADDMLAGVSYPNAVTPTPSVTYAFDPYYARATSMTDGYGTTTYAYVPPGTQGALSIAKETGPAINANASYTYDALGRMAYRAVGGNPETFTYDALGRMNSHGDDIGEFTLSYLGQTTQMTSLQGSGIGTQWTYDTNTNDRRLLSVNSGPATRSFNYTTTAEGDVTGITETLGSTQQSWTDTYNKADRLLTAALSTGASYAYVYDKAGNITSLKSGTTTTALGYNSLNQLKAFKAKTYVYDLNGNLTQDDLHTYTYDAENRLVGVGFLSQPGVSESFRYDGNNHRVVSVLVNGATTTETHYFWCGQTLCEGRNANDKVIKRYFTEGEEAPAAGTLLYYGRDKIGSERDILSAQTGALVGSSDYDPFGNIITTSGTAQTDFRFGQLFYDKTAALYRANFRQYDQRSGRWQNRDPQEESGGVDLYTYANNSPVDLVDPLGLWTGQIGLGGYLDVPLPWSPIGGYNINPGYGIGFGGYGNIGYFNYGYYGYYGVGPYLGAPFGGGPFVGAPIYGGYSPWICNVHIPFYRGAPGVFVGRSPISRYPVEPIYGHIEGPGFGGIYIPEVGVNYPDVLPYFEF